MARSSTCFVRCAVRMLVLTALVVVGWAWPQQAVATPNDLRTTASLEAGPPRRHTPNPEALDWSSSGRCLQTRNESFARAEPRKRPGVADTGKDTPADALQAAARNFDGKIGEAQQAPRAASDIEAPCRAMFQSRAPPSLIHC